MENVNLIPFQPIEGVPVVKIGERLCPAAFPVEYGKTENGYYFIYEGSKRGKLTVNTKTLTETLEEVE